MAELSKDISQTAAKDKIFRCAYRDSIDVRTGEQKRFLAPGKRRLLNPACRFPAPGSPDDIREERLIQDFSLTAAYRMIPCRIKYSHTEPRVATST
jgi:hypothetical protein